MDNERTLFVTATDLAQVIAPMDDRLHCLEAVEGLSVGRRFVVGPEGLIVGRTPPADIVLGDSQVSRQHCRVTAASDHLVVTDLNSTNGVFVDGLQVAGEARLLPGGTLRIGHQALKYERLTDRQLKKAEEFDRDLATACSYVQALLPPPVREGDIRVDWLYQPSATLGGDAFGYYPLDENRFVGYLIDVSGHGAGAAMHSVAVMNLLRRRALPDTDMADPAQVLRTLNAMFQMEDHAEMYFTMWYGVYDRTTRRLDFASAGHHPAFMVSADRIKTTALSTRNGLIGAMPGMTYVSDSRILAPGASVYVFSDGVFEIVTKDGVQWSLSDFTPLLANPAIPGVTEPERLFDVVRNTAQTGDLDDDFSLVVLTFD